MQGTFFATLATMQLIMLSGNSIQNREWIYRSRKEFAKLFNSFYVQDYLHWRSGAEWIDLEYELNWLEESTKRFSSSYAVFAKSIGTVLTAKALHQGIIEPKFLLLVGLPLGYIKSSYPEFAQILFDANLPTTIIHNEFDKVGTAEEAEAYMAEKFSDRGDYQFITTPGDTHNYEDFGLMRTELDRLKKLA